MPSYNAVTSNALIINTTADTSVTLLNIASRVLKPLLPNTFDWPPAKFPIPSDFGL